MAILKVQAAACLARTELIAFPAARERVTTGSRVSRIAPRFPTGFYVYQLVDPRTDLPFYVGKGQRGRAWHHQRAVECGKLAGNARKVAKISDILKAGESVRVVIVAEYHLESDALDHEYRLVDADPTLTNVQPGGGGKQPSIYLEQRRKRLEALRENERQVRLEMRAAKAIEAWGVKERHHDEVAAWIDRIGGSCSIVCINSRTAETKRRKRRRGKRAGRKAVLGVRHHFRG
jgi:hypothetical protein